MLSRFLTFSVSALPLLTSPLGFSGQNILLTPKNRKRRKKCHCMAILGGSDLTKSLHNLWERVFWIVTNTQTDTQTDMATLWLNRPSWADSLKFISWVIYILIKWDTQSWLRSSKVEVIQKSADEKKGHFLPPQCFGYSRIRLIGNLHVQSL